ncbi:MAG: hypothetical protein AB1798_20885, partial [Spirochaetota bacterium]
MKKYVLVSVISLLSVFPMRGKDYFRSDEIGLPLEKISQYRLNDFPYVLVLERGADDREIRRLLHKGDEYKRWETVYAGGEKIKELYFERETLTSETVYGRNGSVVEEKQYK